MLVGSPLLDQDALHEVVEEPAQYPAMVVATGNVPQQTLESVDDGIEVLQC